MKFKRKTVVLIATLAIVGLGVYFLPDIIIAVRLRAVDTVVNEEIAKGSFPGAVVCIGRANKIHYLKAFGSEVIEPFKEAAETNTLFDIASLTKPVATATAVMILLDNGKVSLDDKVAAYLPAFGCNGKEDARIKHLLAHTSGLPAYTNADTLKKQFESPCPDKVIEKICSLKAVSPPGEGCRYSCLGYITLAKIVEIISGKTIDVFANENIFEPLGMDDTTYNPTDTLKERIAATEIIDVDENPLRGTVHDPLARLMAGVSGNAGVFSTGRDLSVFCRMLLAGGTHQGKTILSPRAVAFLTQTQSYGRAYGFDVSSGYSWIKGDFTSDETFCHSGYTGTSIVCDPETKVFLIILANRAHPHDKGTVRPVRMKVADVAFEAFGGRRH
ncbi:MAG: beta-lactamase family protein [Planctomycetes bacterium]|nr:beta-lactamase family protein [Planctomycetota bacterium]